MPIARTIRGTLEELTAEGGDIILLVIGIAILVYAIGPLMGLGRTIKGFIPSGTATISTTGTVGQLTSTWYDYPHHAYPYFHKTTRGYIPAREFIHQLVKQNIA